MNSDQQKLVKAVLDDHQKALDGEEGYKLAELYDQDLVNLEVEGKDLRMVNFQRSILLGSKFKGSDLSMASFSGCFMANSDLSQCNLALANLSHANLFQVNLDNTNLTGVRLQGTVGNMKQVKSMHLETYPVTYTKDIISVGCWQMPIYVWSCMNNDKLWEYIPPDVRAHFVKDFDFDWWDKWKETIFKIIDMSPAED